MKTIVFIIGFLSISSCAQLPGYKKMRVNAEEMQIGESDIDTFSDIPKTYREGSQGGNSGKSGGGCGCN
jgi:hypothetical protein|tara:strand:+ start:4812 stop:5018 length:207 start_codon:yes stop_codon:yes gene_type:complete